MATIQAKKHLAKSLFLNSNLMRKEICQNVGCTYKTLKKWVDENGWENLKEAGTITKSTLLKSAYKQLKQLNEQIEQGGEVISKNQADAKAVLIKEIEAHSDHNLHQYIEVIERLLDYISRHQPTQLQDFSSITSDFIDAKQKALA